MSAGFNRLALSGIAVAVALAASMALFLLAIAAKHWWLNGCLGPLRENSTACHLALVGSDFVWYYWPMILVGSAIAFVSYALTKRA